MCPQCGAYFFNSERLRNRSFHLCCGPKNDIKLTLLPPPPHQLLLYFTTDSTDAIFFQKHIRSINTSFALITMKATEEIRAQPGGPLQYRIHGNIYRHIGPVVPNTNDRPVHGQMYFFQDDDFDPITARLSAIHIPDTDQARSVVLQIQNVLLLTNEHIRALATAKEVIEHHIQEHGLPIEEYRIVLTNDNAHRPRDAHPRRYNAPISNEVAVITPGAGIHTMYSISYQYYITSIS
jgi:hypothetical protein